MSKYFVERQECGRHTIFPGVEIFTAAGDKMLLSLVELQPGAVVERHEHHHEQMGMLVRGELAFTIGDETRTVRPGEMWRIPGHVQHGCKAGNEGATALDVFCPIREEYR